LSLQAISKFILHFPFSEIYVIFLNDLTFDIFYV